MGSFEKLVLNPPGEVVSDLLEARELLYSIVPDAGDSLLNEVAVHISKACGKGIRPMLSIACSRILFDHYVHESILLAAAVELIHIATLLHDDVIDSASERRGIRTVNSLWGNKISILLGDYIFSNAFKLMVKTGNLNILKLLSDTSEKLSKSEIDQIEYNNKGVINEEAYFNVINGKTASLFSAACHAPSLLKDSSMLSNSLALYGECFGIIYQVTDDLLDYLGYDTGKKQGADFSEGKLTLPLIRLIHCADKREAKLITENIGEKNSDSSFFEWLRNLFIKYEIQKQISKDIEKYLDIAIDAVTTFGKSDYRDFLVDLVRLLYKRET